MRQAKLTIERMGYFVVNPLAEQRDVCGLPDNNVLHYKVSIDATPAQLDSRGFIIDNNDIHKYFLGYKKTPIFRSCELIALDACNYFARKLKGFVTIRVSISGNPQAAWLTSEIRNDAKE